jgi:hypothetical protein
MPTMAHLLPVFNCTLHGHRITLKTLSTIKVFHITGMDPMDQVLTVGVKLAHNVHMMWLLLQYTLRQGIIIWVI